MSQFVAKNPPWVRAGASLVQSGAAGSSSHLLTAQQVGHATAAGGALTPGAAGLAAGGANPLATAAAVVAAAQNQQAQQGPAASVSYGTGLAAITLTQSALQQGAMLQQQGLAIPASLAATPQVASVNNGMVVEIARLPQPGVALPTSLATTQVATVSYPAPRLLAQTTQYQGPHQTAVVQPAAVVQPHQVQQQQPPQQQYKHRVFTGTVTKLHDNFGFVDDDVFFQISSVKGNIPKVGERVLAEATYNANMPFKWNASRIQVLPNQVMQINLQQNNNNRSLGQQVAAVVAAAPTSLGINVSQSVGMNAAIASIANNQAAFSNVGPASQRWQVQPELAVVETIGQRLNLPHNNQHPWIQEVEFSEMSSRVSTIGRRHNSPPPIRRDRDREVRREERRDRHRPERDRYSPPPRKRSRSPRRSSRSPPRRRFPRTNESRVRYTVQIPKISLDLKTGNVLELKRRYSNLYVPSDFCAANFLWQDVFPSHRPFSLDHPCGFHIISKDVENILDSESIIDPSDADYSFSAKVMLMSVPPMTEIYHKACALAHDSDETKDNFVHPTRLINFLVGLKGKNETMAIGGPWSPSLDGPNPQKDPSVLIKTAIRTCRSLTGIDLSKCSQWYRFAEICYRRGESHKGRGTRVETVVFFVPDVWSCLPTRCEWEAIIATGSCKKTHKQPEETASDHEAQEEDESTAEDPEKREPTHYSELDPKTIKVSDLKRELEVRNLSVKGLKSQLIARLTKALKTESEKENEEKTADGEKGEFDVIDEATDEDKRKEDEKQRYDREKELKNLPEFPAILVQPSRTAKNGKFDCALMSLSLLLDYRPEDNKEHSFEVSLFAELFNEMMMRDFGFRIYRALVEAPEVKDDEKDKKKTDKKDEKKDRKDEKDDNRRRDDGNDYDSDKDDDDSDDEDNEDDKRDRKKRRKKKPQMHTHDPYLLLSFVYYDQTHSGYILDKDIEELLHTLGLLLSRAQIRKLIQKVCKRDMLRYRKLTDRAVDGEKQGKSETINLEDLASGNKKYIPSFKCVFSELDLNSSKKDEEGKSAVISHQGALVNVGKLMEQLERSEKARLENDAKLGDLQVQIETLNEEALTKEKQSQKLSHELDDQKLKISKAEEDLRRSRNEADRYHRALCSLKESLQSSLFTTDVALQQRTRSSRLSRVPKEETTNGVCEDVSLMDIKQANDSD